jgi:diaminopimelate decarboxylase
LAVKNSHKVIININDNDELKRVIQFSRKYSDRLIKISFRVNPKGSGAWSKYGINLNDLKKSVSLVSRQKNIHWVGVHTHSSWNVTPRKYLSNIKEVGKYLKNNFLPKSLNELEFVDLGGGFYPEWMGDLLKSNTKGKLSEIVKNIQNESVFKNFDGLKFQIEKVEPLEIFASEIAKSLGKYILPLNSKIKIYFEPGRFIVTHSTTILVKVLSVKKDSVIVDGGINMVGDYRFDEGYYAPIVNLSNYSLSWQKKIIYGPLCDPYDLWGYSYYGKKIRKGDILAIIDQGAYTFSCAWRFVKPIEQYIVRRKNGNLCIANYRETFKDRYGKCIL